MKKKKSTDTSRTPAKPKRPRAKHPRTPTGKKADPELRASAEKGARAGTKERLEEGHMMAGRLPPSQTPQRRATDRRQQVDESIRSDSLVTEDEKLLQQPAPDRGRGGGAAGDLVGDDGAGLGIDQIDQPERELGELLLLLVGVLRLLDIQIGHHPQQRWPDIDAVAVTEFDQGIQIGKVQRFDHGCPEMTARKKRIYPRLAPPPLANR